MSDPVVLAPKLDLAAATALLATLRASEDDEVVLDMSKVKHFGALCMQVILAVANDFAATGRKLTMIDASDRVVDQMRVMGMTPESVTRGRQ